MDSIYQSNIIRPKNHPLVENESVEKCPYFQIQQKNNLKENYEEKKINKQDSDSDEEEPKGGCPFMNTSQSKRNPGLSHLDEGYDIPYISSMDDLLKSRGTYKKNEFDAKRIYFDKYPIYLKETIFHDDENMNILRKKEITEVFFISENWREKGNRYFNKGDYKNALIFYLRVFSLFKWIELTKIDKGVRVIQKNKEKGLKILEECKKEQKNIKNNDFEETEETEDVESEEENEKNLNTFKESKEYLEYEKEEENKKFEEKYKTFLSIFTDENTKVFNGEGIIEENDIDLRNSNLITIYLSLCLVYMKINCFSVARECCEDALKINNTNVSMIYFRRSQTLLYNKNSNLQDLELAKTDILTAINIIKTEKLFKQKKEMLMLLNIHNAADIYNEHLKKVEEKIDIIKNQQLKEIKKMILKVKDRYFIDSILDKKEKHTNTDSTTLTIYQEDRDYSIIKIMIKRYLRMIEFFAQTNNKDQESIALKELQYIKEIENKMNFYLNLNFKNFETNPLIILAKSDINLDFKNEEVLKKFDQEKKKKIKEIFDNADFNLEIFNYAIHELLKLESKRKQLNKKELDSCCGFKFEDEKKGYFSSLLNINTIVKILFLLIVLLIFFEMSKKSGFFKNIQIYFQKLSSKNK